MKKLVIKTVFITVMAILTISIAVLSAICVFKPKVIAKMFDNLGNYEASQYFYQMQYEKTGDIDEIFMLIDNAYEKNDFNNLKGYVGELISHKNFKFYCQSKNSTLDANAMKTEEYYSSWYAELLFIMEDFGVAVEFSKSYVVNQNGSVNVGYTKYNPFRILVDKKAQLSSEQKQVLKTEIEDFKTKIIDSVQLGYIEQDLNQLN